MKERTTKLSHRPTSKDIKAETNIRRMLDAIASHGMFHSECENKGLWNFLESKLTVSKPMTCYSSEVLVKQCLKTMCRATYLISQDLMPQSNKNTFVYFQPLSQSNGV